METDTISISQLKIHCLRILAELKSRNKSLTVTKNGIPLVIIYPASEKTTRPKFGFAKGSAEINGDVVSPLSEEDWEVLK